MCRSSPGFFFFVFLPEDVQHKPSSGIMHVVNCSNLLMQKTFGCHLGTRWIYNCVGEARLFIDLWDIGRPFQESRQAYQSLSWTATCHGVIEPLQKQSTRLTLNLPKQTLLTVSTLATCPNLRQWTRNWWFGVLMIKRQPACWSVHSLVCPSIVRYCKYCRGHLGL